MKSQMQSKHISRSIKFLTVYFKRGLRARAAARARVRPYGASELAIFLVLLAPGQGLAKPIHLRRGNFKKRRSAPEDCEPERPDERPEERLPGVDCLGAPALCFPDTPTLPLLAPCLCLPDRPDRRFGFQAPSGVAKRGGTDALCFFPSPLQGSLCKWTYKLPSRLQCFALELCCCVHSLP